MKAIYSHLRSFIFFFVTTLFLGLTVQSGYADCSQVAKLVLTVTEQVADPSDTSISVSGGLAPYHWSTCGTGFSLASSETENGNNQLNASGIGCRYGTVTVKDSCGQVVQKSVRGNSGQWVQVDGYNGDCVLTGTAADDYLYWQGGYYKFLVVEGNYKLLQKSGVYEGQHHCTSEICATCCHECTPLPQEERVSCFSRWEDRYQPQCDHDAKVNDNCITTPSAVSGCGIPGDTGCGNYLMSYCFHHIKTLYKWVCDEPNECESKAEANLGPQKPNCPPI